MFGPENGNHCRLRLGVKIGVKKHGDLNYIVYDEMEYFTEFDLEVRAEVIYATFKETTLLPTPATRTAPVFTTLDVSKTDYADFLDYLQLRVDEFKSLLNDDVVGVGVPLPYWKL